MSDHDTVAQHALIAAVQPSLSDFLVLRGAEITPTAATATRSASTTTSSTARPTTAATVPTTSPPTSPRRRHLHRQPPDARPRTGCIGLHRGSTSTTRRGTRSRAMELITGNYDIGVSAFVPRVSALPDMLRIEGSWIAGIGGSDDHTAGINEGAAGSDIGSRRRSCSPTTSARRAIRRGQARAHDLGPPRPGRSARRGDDAQAGRHAGRHRRRRRRRRRRARLVHAPAATATSSTCSATARRSPEAGDGRRLQDDVRRRARRQGAALPGRADLRHEHADRTRATSTWRGRGGGAAAARDRGSGGLGRCSSCSTP